MEGVRRSSQRQEIISALRLLCDGDLHDRWRKGEATWPSLTDAVHGLIDDTWPDRRSASELIPATFVGEEEAAAVDRAAAALAGILDDLGPTRGDSDHQSHPGLARCLDNRLGGAADA
jgi:hypothetical protein